MGLFDLFKKKDAKPAVNEVKEKSTNVEIKTDNKRMDLKEFSFESKSHLRYQGGNPRTVQQNCHRTIIVRPNHDGNYLVSILNGSDYTMAPKQMKLIEEFRNKIILNGYGYDPLAVGMGMAEEGNFAYYGLTIYLKDNQPVKCVLHMYDRDVDIVYFAGSNGEMVGYSDPKPEFYPLNDSQMRSFITRSVVWKNFEAPDSPGTYHFIIQTRVTEKMVGISDDDSTEYTLYWELLRREEYKMHKYFVFCGWGDSMSTGIFDGLPQFNFYEIGLDEEQFLSIFIRLMNSGQLTTFSLRNLKRTVGFESVPLRG